MNSSRLNGDFVAEHLVPPVPLFPRVLGNTDDPIMKKLLLLARPAPREMLHNQWCS
jgi:hypothetical protein